MKLFQRAVIRLGEARLQLLGGVSLVELERNHRELKPAKQPQKPLSGLMDPLFGFGLQHSLEGFGIDRVGSKPCTNLLDISVQVRLDSRKGCRAEDVCETTTEDEQGVAVEDRNGAPNIFTTPLEASRNCSVSTPPSIGTSANDCQSDQSTSPSPLPQANSGMDMDGTFGRVSKKVAIGFGEGEVGGTKLEKVGWWRCAVEILENRRVAREIQE